MANPVVGYSPGGGYYATNPITGTSENAYPATPQVQWNTAHVFRHKTIFIENTGGSNTLLFKIALRPSTDAMSLLIPTALYTGGTASGTDMELAPSTGAWISFEWDVAQVDISINSKVDGSQSTFTIICTGHL